MALDVGSEIDGYRLLGVLGRGGMGVVYKAEDVALSRMVALKMIDPTLARDESFLRRFRAEARALARIDSPFIVRIHALRQAGDLLFIVMEYVDGGTLADLERPVKLAAAQRFVMETMLALEHAHGVNVVHRDIKPNNLMVTEAGQVKVTDFGLATVRQRNSTATVTQAVAGTLYYMSPEQVKGLTSLDHRSDLYSFGMTIYELLAGRLPFDRDGSEFSIMRTIVEEELPPITHFRPDLPASLDRALQKALDKDPDRRYQSAAEMRAAFEEVFETVDPAQAGSPGLPRGSKSTAQADRGGTRPATGSRTRMMGIAAALVLVAALGATWYWVAGRTPDGPGVGPVETTGTVQAAQLLSVGTVPAGATIYVDGRNVGQAPLTALSVPGDVASVRVELAGYDAVDTTLQARDGVWPPLELALRPASPSRGGLAITSEPGGADVYIDGQRRGRTPLTLSDLEAGTRTIRLEREGYASWSEQARVRVGAQSEVAARLQQVAVAATGTLRVRTQGVGPVFVDGDRIAAPEAGVTVPVGAQRVQCGEGAGAAAQSVQVVAREVHELTCYFAHDLNVQAIGADGTTNVWGSVYLNGQHTGEYTPWTRSLETGEYRIMVQREGFVTLEEEQTIEVRPAFEPVQHKLVFRLQSRP